MNGSKNASTGLYAPIAMPTGTARSAAMTNPPSVATAHTAKKSTKKAAPRRTWAPRETGLSGVRALSSLHWMNDVSTIERCPAPT